MEESERARMEIIEENKHVKGLVVTAVNGMQEIVHEAREDGGKDEVRDGGWAETLREILRVGHCVETKLIDLDAEHFSTGGRKTPDDCFGPGGGPGGGPVDADGQHCTQRRCIVENRDPRGRRL